MTREEHKKAAEDLIDNAYPELMREVHNHLKEGGSHESAALMLGVVEVALKKAQVHATLASTPHLFG